MRGTSKLLRLLVPLAVVAIAAAPAYAGPIVAPVAGVINYGGPGEGSLTDTFNQNGLLTGYTSGVTDFNTYMALNPMHSLTFAGYEWFSQTNTTAAGVTYDLGSVMWIDALALWNEESSGIGRLDLSWSADNITYLPLLTGLAPIDNPLADYPAQVFNFGAVNARYVRFDMSECPQPLPGSYPSCAIGEVAFDNQAGQGTVPEPTSMLLFGTGLVGLRAWRKRRG